MNKKLLDAIDLALAGKWDEAHGIVQPYDRDETASWIHAVLHKMEERPSFRRQSEGRNDEGIQTSTRAWRRGGL